MTKPIILVKICYKLLYVIIQVVLIGDSWPQLISRLHIGRAASYWPQNSKAIVF